MKKYVALAIGLILLIGFLLLVVAFPLGIRMISQIPAEAFLRDVAAIRPGTSTLDDVQRLGKKYGGRSMSIAGVKQPCTAQGCQLLFVFGNAWVNLFRSSQAVSFRTQVIVKDGRVASTFLVYQTRPRVNAGSPPGAHDSPAGQPGMVTPFNYKYGVLETAERADKDYGIRKGAIDGSGIPHSIVARLGPLSTAEDRKRAYAIDLSCLGKWHGCDGPAAVYPAGWENLQ